MRVLNGIAWSLAAVLSVVGAAWIGDTFHRACGYRGGGDYVTPWSAARLFVAGRDPYRMDVIVREYDAHDGAFIKKPSTRFTPSVYPPGTFLVLAPVAAPFRWPAGRNTFAVVNLAAIVFIAIGTVALAGVRWTDWRAPALVAAVLLLGPNRDGLYYGQPIVVTAALIVAAAWAAARNRDTLAGLLLAVAVTLKPPIAGPFALYFLLRRRYRMGTVALVGAAVLTGVAAARLSLAGVPWLAELRANLHEAELTGAVNDPTFANFMRFDMVNLHVLLHAWVDDRAVVSAIAWAVAAGLAAAFAVAVVRRDRAGDLPGRTLAELSFVAAWALLPMYHRWHDAAPLVLALSWAAVAAPARRWSAAGAASLVLAPFVVAFSMHAGNLRPPSSFPGRARLWVDAVVMPNQNWAVLAMCGLLLSVLWRRPGVPRTSTADRAEKRMSEPGPDTLTGGRR